jgi:predicted nucleic acid-binding protein
VARAERLTVYDAAYLELAERRHLPLMTLDNDLAAAAVRREVVVLPAPDMR